MVNIKQITALKLLQESHTTLRCKEFRPILEKAMGEYNSERYDECMEILRSAPSSESVFSNLIERLKGKSVHTTLKRMAAKKDTSSLTEMKALFSLGTHVIIDCEQGITESAILLPDIYERIGKLIPEI